MLSVPLVGAVTVESAGGSVGANPVDGYVRNPGSVFSKDVPTADLLRAIPPDIACTKAAFAENLHVDALATDGWNTLNHLDADAVPVAFALELKVAP